MCRTPGAAVHRLGGRLDLVRRGRGEDLAGAGRVQHALAHEAAVQGLVAATATGDDGHLALDRRVDARYEGRIGVRLQPVAVSRRDTRQRFTHGVFWPIDELLHLFSSWPRSCRRGLASCRGPLLMIYRREPLSPGTEVGVGPHKRRRPPRCRDGLPKPAHVRRARFLCRAARVFAELATR